MVDAPKIKQCSIDHKNAPEQGKLGDLFLLIVSVDSIQSFIMYSSQLEIY
jgi:hypothetical protein